ncbi:D-2-hydroxyacid dehydrogenase [Yinghuangia sp. YIM S09857]|uniref:D-2-hydroxyacid dehydrogenase n=1 Tax=Yinghuangia sp. YIM S09857 TaxID=3436929 RepID=UPI003F52B4CD
MTPIVVGIMYPPAWDVRPRETYEADLAALRALDPRIEIVECRYIEDNLLRTERGRPGSASDAGLRARAPKLTADQREGLARVEVALVADLPFDVADLAPNLRWVQSVAAGNGQLVSAGLPTERVTATTAAGVNGTPIAEFAFARLLAHLKGHRELEERQREHRWQAVFGAQVAGRTLGLVGVGGIGGEIAKRAQAFGMTVYATRRRTDRPAPNVDRLFHADDLHAMLGECDAVISAAPETPDTVDTMDAAAFAAMRPGSFYCNVGRGSFVVEKDLIEALESGRLAAAALDVTRTEPLPAEDPLWDAPNIYISAHCSSDGRDHFTGVFRLFRENLAKYLAGEPLRNEVDPASGY